MLIHTSVSEVRPRGVLIGCNTKPESFIMVRVRVQPRRGAFQVMAHQRLSSGGETKEPFCSPGSSRSTPVTIEACSSFLHDGRPLGGRLRRQR